MKLKHGTYCRTNRKGITILSGKYHKGKRTGQWIYRLPGGELEKLQIYKKGVLVEKRVYYLGRIGGDMVEELFYEKGKLTGSNNRQYSTYIDPPKNQSGTKDFNDLDFYEAKELAEMGDKP